MKTKGFFVLLAFFLISAFMLSWVCAANNSGNPNNHSGNEFNINQNDSNTKNMTYGQCVIEGVKLKQNCYLFVKNQSKEDYKTSKAQCKKDFKLFKQDCKKIKHNFLETLRYGLY